MSYSAIDLSRIAPPDIVESLSVEEITNQMLDDLKKRDKDFSALVESDPAYKVLEVAAYRETLLRSRINHAARSVMLPWATGSDLDNLGALFRTSRHEVTKPDNTKIPPVPSEMESDNDYRKRIYLAPEGLSNAGTEGSYISRTMEADGDVKDAGVKSVEPGKVLISILSRSGNGKASDDLIDRVNKHMQQPDIRQLTDQVTIRSAEIVEYKITATLHVYPGPGVSQIKELATEAVRKYVDDYHQVGMIVPLSGIYKELQGSGVVRVELKSPKEDITPSDDQAAWCSSIELEVVTNE